MTATTTTTTTASTTTTTTTTSSNPRSEPIQTSKNNRTNKQKPSKKTSNQARKQASKAASKKNKQANQTKREKRKKMRPAGTLGTSWHLQNGEGGITRSLRRNHPSPRTHARVHGFQSVRLAPYLPSLRFGSTHAQCYWPGGSAHTRNSRMLLEEMEELHRPNSKAAP